MSEIVNTIASTKSNQRNVTMAACGEIKCGVYPNIPRPMHFTKRQHDTTPACTWWRRGRTVCAGWTSPHTRRTDGWISSAAPCCASSARTAHAAAVGADSVSVSAPSSLCRSPPSVRRGEDLWHRTTVTVTLGERDKILLLLLALEMWYII